MAGRLLIRMSEQPTVVNAQQAGWGALAAGDWRGARACFERALATDETAEALEGLGWAAYCLDDDPLTFHARERAFHLYRKQGDDGAAARVAAWLAADWLEFRGKPAVANGWLLRAHRLLDDQEPGPGHGWLAVHEASIIVDEDPVGARRLAGLAVEIGRRFGVPELEMVGLGLEGVALVSEGDLAAGMGCLDEAVAAALSGEVELLVCVAWACCYLIAACEQVRDYDRAGEWCERVGEFCERHDIALPLSVCKAKYAGVLTWQGRWDEAEDELRSAADGLAASRPPLIGDALVRLAELRRRQGRYEDAEDLFEKCEGKPLALVGRAALALDRGRPGEAAELAERFLRGLPDQNRTERAAGLEIAVRAYASLAEYDRARSALEELDEIASRARTRPLRGAVLAAEAAVAAAASDHDAARCSLEDAIDLLAACGAPFETARARLDLAASLTALGRREPARRELETARASLRELGAVSGLARAEAMLNKLGETPPVSHIGASEGPLVQLSRREIEVLGLVAQGLTNYDIAERLVISEHTVHRHVTNLLRKLGLPSRTAAASFATRHGVP
jgi:LuxR family transcriptional regulator, maltose regulon positive regulatory protein